MPARRRLVALFLLLLLLALPASAGASPAQNHPRITVRYFYNNPCRACNEAGEFLKQFYQAVGSADEGISVDVIPYNTFQTANQAKFQEACRKYGIPEQDQALPMVFINDTWISGKEGVEARWKEAFLAEKARLLAGQKQSYASTLLYFYVSPCDECAEVKAFMDTLESSYPVTSDGKTADSPLAIMSYNVADPEGLELAQELFARYHVPGEKQEVPILFLRNSYLSGADEIKGQLIDKIKNGDSLNTVVPGDTASAVMLTAYEWPGIFLTGLINGFNPCSISLLLFLIALLLARNASVLKLGITFIAGKAVAYLLLGTVLFGALLTIDNRIFRLFTDAAKYVLLAVVLVVAAVNVSDFVAAKNEKYERVRMQLPVSLRKLNHNWINKLAKGVNARLLLPAVLALGLLVSVGEFLCTGQIYLATILYMIKRSQALDLQTFGAFLVYVAGMMTPLIVLTLAVWKGREVFGLSELIRKNMPLVKLLNAAVFIIFGVILFFYL